MSLEGEEKVLSTNHSSSLSLEEEKYKRPVPNLDNLSPEARKAVLKFCPKSLLPGGDR